MNGTPLSSRFPRLDLMQIASTAAYQVGLSFLTNNMQRAPLQRSSSPPSSIANDPLGPAMESLTLSPSISGLGSATPPPSCSLPWGLLLPGTSHRATGR
jgi:hypothetical protein